jgi:catechol 2,3-dioxygenase-like lactoylglutathione lyase family enzyme
MRQTYRAGCETRPPEGVYCAAGKNIIAFTPLFSFSFCLFGEKIRLKIMQQLISGIQQIGIGIPDAGSYFTWFRKTFGYDVKIFDDEAKATLMTKYTGGEVHARRAILAMNMNGGGGAEIWQFTSRKTNYPATPLVFGDYGINAAKIKCTDVEQTYNELKNKVNCSPLYNTPLNEKTFWVTDEFGNAFQVVKNSTFFKRKPYMVGGVGGAVIGVSNMEKAILFYSAFGISHVEYDKTGKFEDLGEAYSNSEFRRVLLSFNNNFTAPFSKLLGNVEIELLQAKDRTPVKIFENRYWGDGGFIHLCFDVSDMNALKKRLSEKGSEFTVDSADTFDMGKAGGRFAYAEDPDGTLIEMVETHKVPILKKLGWYLDLKKRGQHKPLPNWMINTMGLNKVKD